MSGNSSIKISNLQLKYYPDNTDELVAWSNASGNAVLLPISNIFNGTNNSLLVSNLVLTVPNTPLNSTINVTVGQMWYDTNYLYIAVANNTIKRVSLSSF